MPMYDMLAHPYREVIYISDDGDYFRPTPDAFARHRWYYQEAPTTKKYTAHLIKAD
jgi:hypothetical protein